jgi:hypothetical protein
MGWTVLRSTPGRDKIIFSPKTRGMVLGPIQPRILQLPAVHSAEVKQTEHKDVHSNPSTSEVQN